ncbi:MAG: ABC transporter substrate-binding protein [Chloroflexota bacterium]
MTTRRGVLSQGWRMALGATALGPLAAACAAPGVPGGTERGAGPVGNPSAPVTTTVWHGWGDNREPIINEIFRKMRDKYPNVTVESTVSLPGVLEEKFGTALVAGNPPDTAMLRQHFIPQFGLGGGLESLDAWVTRDKLKLKQLFYETDVDGCSFDGQYWMLPHSCTNANVQVAFNKDMTGRAGLDLDKNPPQTWDEVLQTAVSLTKRENGAITQLGADLDTTPALFDVYAGTVGSAAYSPDGRKVTFNEPKSIEVMEWLLRARQALGGRADIATFRAQFPAGQQLFEDARSLALNHRNYAIYGNFPVRTPDLKWGAFSVVPQRKDASMALPNKPAWGWGMASASKVKDAAWLVLRKMTTEEDGGAFLQLQLGQPAPLRKVQESGDLKKYTPYWQVVVKTVEQRWKRPASYVPPDVDMAWQALVGRIAREEVSARSGLIDGAAQVQALLDAYWRGRGR